MLNPQQIHVNAERYGPTAGGVIVNDNDQPEVQPAEPGGHLVRSPAIPVTLAELAARKSEAIEIVEARIQVLQTLRKAAIRITSPEDWLLFRAPQEQGGQVIGYLQDCGCDRIRDLYGIEVFDVGEPFKVLGTQPGHFHYLIRGSGRCKLTGQKLENVEGGRSSTDDVCRNVEGVALELLVRKSARANLDGNITRELAGLKSVPLEEIAAAWADTKKTTDHCRRGRGFGTAAERLGATRAGEPDIEPPACPHCGATGKFRQGKDGRGDFWGCPNYQKHADKKWTVDAAKWQAEHAARPTAPAGREPGIDDGPLV